MAAGSTPPSSSCAAYRRARQRSPGLHAPQTATGSVSDSAMHASCTGTCSRKRTCRGSERVQVMHTLLHPCSPVPQTLAAPAHAAASAPAWQTHKDMRVLESSAAATPSCAPALAAGSAPAARDISQGLHAPTAETGYARHAPALLANAQHHLKGSHVIQMQIRLYNATSFNVAEQFCGGTPSRPRLMSLRAAHCSSAAPTQHCRGRRRAGWRSAHGETPPTR